jgi:MYXO-CTERM domain-containing protein
VFLALPIIALWSTASLAGEAPEALAGVPFLAYPGETVVLDGSGSYDPDGDALVYDWVQESGPLVELERVDTNQPRFVAEEAGVVSVLLTVTDTEGLSGTDIVDVIIVAPDAGQQMGDGGCATGRGPPWAAALGLLALLLRRRR